MQKKNLFEMLSNADQERIHTQTIAWLLSPTDSPLNQEQLKELYSKLFGDEITIKIDQSLKVSTEYEQIDLIIEDSKYIIAIENKLKSQQSKDQLEKYDKKLKEINVNGKKLNKFFLTFSGEVSKSEEWVDLDYEKIHKSIASLKLDNVYVNDYQALLKRMLEAKDYFLGDDCDRTEVIRRSGLPTKRRVTDQIESDSEHINYICNNRLERLFVEMYCRKIMCKVGVAEWVVKESHGTALIQVNFEILDYKNPKIRLVPGFQLQKNTIKYNISEEDYASSKKDNLPGNLIKKLEMEMEGKGFRKNEGRTKAYLSFSYSIESKSFFEMKFEDAVSFIGSEIKECKETWAKVRQTLRGEKLI